MFRIESNIEPSELKNTLTRKTKIIATLGPASSSEEMVSKLLIEGVNLFRLNASHISDGDIIRDQVHLIRTTSEKTNRFSGIFLDLQGPKIRVGTFENDKATLENGAAFTLTTDSCDGTADKASVSYRNFHNDVKPGEPIFIDDGKIKLRCEKVEGKDVICTVTYGGVVSNKKGINLPETDISFSAITDKDKRDIAYAVENNLDYVALSFVSRASDIQDLRTLLDELGGQNIKIIAKIERQKAIDNIEEIIDEADAVMVARGDLGVEIGVENVPRYQKMIIQESNCRLRPVIVATQMLESMITSTIATRAEASDVANAIYDHCDAVMLSGETATGVRPDLAVKTMANICRATDDHMVQLRAKRFSIKKDIFVEKTTATSFCKAADQIAEENKAAAILAFTSSGNTPLIASKLGTTIPIISPTDSVSICQRTTLYRGILPLLLPKEFSAIARWTDMISLAIKKAKKIGYLKTGDVVVVTAGIPIGISNGINSIRILTVT